MTGNKTLTTNSQCKTSRMSSNSRKYLFVDTAILSMSDLERIRKNANILTKEEEMNNKKIYEDQKQFAQANAQAHKERIKEIDKQRSGKGVKSDIDKENMQSTNNLLAQAKQMMDEEHDLVKDMNKFVLYSKVATIRDRQLEEKKKIISEYKYQNSKMDLMMEYERLKELKFQEDREIERKEQQKQGALIIIDQIKERDIERLKQKENCEKERHMIVKQMKELEEDDKRVAEIKKVKGAKLSKEVSEANNLAIELKDRRKIEEKELELKIFQYNLDKIKKEEEELAEKKRIQEEKEKEVQKLREKQERARDKQAELDAIRAKRAYEEAERVAREKERQEIIIKNNKVVELLEANEKQKFDKEYKLAEQAKQEQEEYQRIIEKQIKDLENERTKEEDKKRIRFDHNHELRRQIKEKEELSNQLKRETLEDGRKLKQKHGSELNKLEKIKENKIGLLKNIEINSKYISTLERFKIK